MSGLEIAGAVAGFIGTATGVAAFFRPQISRQFSLCFSFSNYIDSLEHEAEKLDYKRRDVEKRLEADRVDGREVPLEIVAEWLAATATITSTKERILEDERKVKNGCSNFCGRYSVSKEARETREGMKKLIEECTFESVSHPPPVAATLPIPFGKEIHEITSRKLFEDRLMNALKREDVDKIGVWGATGVGKRTMGQTILNRALTNKEFDEVAMVTVGEPVEKMVIQKQIAETLELELNAATALRARLISQEKRTLILLVDVLEDLNLEELGIPCHPKWCTIIITSQDKEVLTRMVNSDDNVFELGVLNDDEAWDFFRKMTGTCVDSDELRPTAYKVMKGCNGLLAALEIVGEAHKDKKHRSFWKDSLEQLEVANPEDISGVLEKVYKPLKLGYERLESRNAKSTILLCCMFAKRADIPLEHLTYLAMGLRLFEDVRGLEKVRGRIRTLTETLKNCCMLLGGAREGCVRMHDVVRNVCIHIASKEMQLVKCKDCAWFSSFVKGGEVFVPPFPNLKLLFMNGKVEQEMNEINDYLIGGGSAELKVLWIDQYVQVTELPLITSLTTLLLQNCRSLRSIAVVGQLESLEILICRSCRSMNELPEQVTGLKRLKLLEISDCHNLTRVAAGVISSLVALEELKIVGSFSFWKGSEEGNEARLKEIESLKRLRCLDIKVSAIKLAAQPLRLPSTLVQFRVHFGMGVYPRSPYKESFQREMLLLDDGHDRDVTNYEDSSSSAANAFLASTEWLSAAGANRNNESFTLNLATARSLRGLGLYKFGNNNNIASAAAAIPLLEFLSLEYLQNLEEIWSDASIPSTSFNKLKRLKLSKLQALKRMGKSTAVSTTTTTTHGFFSQLEIMTIEGCKEMKHLLFLETNGDNIELLFPNLKRLSLVVLPKLTSICNRGIDSIQFPLLEEMVITSCQKLKWINSRDDGLCQDNDSLHLFCHPKVSFGSLKKVRLGYTARKNAWCPNIPDSFFGRLVHLRVEKNRKIKSFSSSRIAQNLVHLQKLEIRRCDEMVKVIEDEDDVSSLSSSTTTTLFPSLQHLSLSNLPKLESFCERRHALELSYLKNLWIKHCSKMKCFNGAGSLITPALQKGSLNGQNVETGVDVNAGLHQRFERAQRERLSRSRSVERS